MKSFNKQSRENTLFPPHCVTLHPLHRSTPGPGSTHSHKWRPCWTPQRPRPRLRLRRLLLWVPWPRRLCRPPSRCWRKGTSAAWTPAKTCGVLEVTRITDAPGPPGLWLGVWRGAWLLAVGGASRTSRSCAWFALRRSWPGWGQPAARWRWAWTAKPPSACPRPPPPVCPCPTLCRGCPQVPARPRRRAKARPPPAASTPRWPLPAHGLVREGGRAAAAAETPGPSRRTTTARAPRGRRRARPAACTAAPSSAPRRTGGAAAGTPPTRPCTACASGPVCGAQRACSTTACRTLRGSSGSLARAMTLWGATRTPSAVPAGWPSWPCRSSCPACAATCLCAPACAVGSGAAAAGASTRRSDEARRRGAVGGGSPDQGGVSGTGSIWGGSGWSGALSRPQNSITALQSPTAFHCILLFLFSTLGGGWAGLPHWSSPAAGAPRSGSTGATWSLS